MILIDMAGDNFLTHIGGIQFHKHTHLFLMRSPLSLWGTHDFILKLSIGYQMYAYKIVIQFDFNTDNKIRIYSVVKRDFNPYIIISLILKI